MKRISNLSIPNYTEKIVSISDFSSITKCAYNVIPTEKGLISENLTAEKIYDLPLDKIKKIYYVDNNLFAYCENQELYCCVDGNWSMISYAPTPPIIERVYVNGVWKILIATQNEQTIYNGVTLESVSIPYSSVYETYKYRLFAGRDNAISYSSLANALEFGEGKINTDALYGEIIGLFAQKDKLIVLCERAIYHLIVSDGTSGFSLVKQDLDVELTKNLITALDGNIYFINRGEFCVYDGYSGKKVQTKKDLIGYSFEGKLSSSVGLVYVVCSKNLGQKKLLVLDTINGCDTFMAFNGEVTNGGHVVGVDGIYKLKRQTLNEQAFWESVPLDLSSPYKKALTRFSIRANGFVKVGIIGAYSSKTFNLENGGVVKLNMPSYAYRVWLNFNTQTKIENIKLVYRIKEN